MRNHQHGEKKDWNQRQAGVDNQAYYYPRAAAGSAAMALRTLLAELLSLLGR